MIINDGKFFKRDRSLKDKWIFHELNFIHIINRTIELVIVQFKDSHVN